MFFKELFEVMTPGVDVFITVRKKDEILTVSLYPKMRVLKDEAQHSLQPIVLSGTPEELDSGFFVSVNQPLKKSSGLLINMREFEASLEKASAKSKENADKTKNTDSVKEKYGKLMSCSEELENKQKFRESLDVLREARKIAAESQYPEIDERITRMKAKCMQGSLFAEMA